MCSKRTFPLLASGLMLALLASCDLVFGGVGAVINASPTMLTLGATKPGETLSATVEITNTGTSGGTVDFQGGEPWILLSTTSVYVEAGETAVVDVVGECTETISESLATGTLRIDSSDLSFPIAVSLACFSADLAVIDANAYLSGEVSESPAAVITLANTTGESLAFEVQNAAAINVTPASGVVTSHGLLDLSLTSFDACSSLRDVEDVSFDVISTAGTSGVDAFKICAKAPVNAYNVDIRFFGEGFDVTSITAFLAAAEKWEAVITNDLVDRSGLTTDAGDCSGPDFPNEPGLDDATVDDILIYAGLFFDKPFGVVGSAGPCIVRSSSSTDALLPVYGTAFFDSADVQRLQTEGKLDAVILHEMGHVIGIGTIWDEFDLVAYAPESNPCRLTNSFTTAPNYLGTAGIAAYESLTGGPESSVPVEDEGGAGTQCGHWDEEVFANELMTGTLDTGEDPLSELTGESLLDLGYATDPSAYEPYDLPLCSPNCLVAADEDEDHGTEILLFPRYEIAPDGTIEPL